MLSLWGCGTFFASAYSSPWASATDEKLPLVKASLGTKPHNFRKVQESYNQRKADILFSSQLASISQSARVQTWMVHVEQTMAETESLENTVLSL